MKSRTFIMNQSGQHLLTAARAATKCRGRLKYGDIETGLTEFRCGGEPVWATSNDYCGRHEFLRTTFDRHRRDMAPLVARIRGASK